MEFFILLVLSLGFCQASSLQDEVDCDDPEVFNAVDRAIKALNEDRNQGNKFALNVILQAYRIAGPTKQFHVVYQVRETACPITEKEPWQNCDLVGVLEGDSGNCTADIDIHESQQFSSISQNCKIRPGLEKIALSNAQCLGCWDPIDSESLEVLPIVRYIIQQFNNQSKQPALFDVGVIRKVHRQVVNGWNYQLEYLIKETNCSKTDFPDVSPECRPLPGGQEGSCIAKAHVDTGNALVFAEHACRLEVEKMAFSLGRACPGCPVSIATDSPELKAPLEAVLQSFNAKNNFYFKIVKVIKATTQIVAGIMYRFEFNIQKTNCSKVEAEKPDEDCTVMKDGELLYCHGSVYAKPWESLMIPQVTCRNKQPLQLTFRAPPGFTPFRGVPRTSTQIRTGAVGEFHPAHRGLHIHRKRRSHSDAHGRHTHGNRQGHGHAHGHRQGHRHGHKKPMQSSSEEFAYLPSVQTPSQLPTSKPFLEQETTSGSPYEESVGFSDVSPTHSSPKDSPLFLDQLPDLPEPPKCPGTPWKPTRDPDPQDTSFNDFDLLDALQK